MKNQYLKGVFYCLIATLSWGCMFPVMTSALQKIDAFNFTLIRYTLACVVFILFLLMREGKRSFKIDGNQWLLFIFGSAGFAGFGFLVFLGQNLAGSSGALSASVMMATMPMIGLLMIWALKSKRPPIYSFIFIAMSFLGVLLVITHGHLSRLITMPNHYVANILMIAGAICWVIYTIGATYFPNWSPLKYTALSTLYGLPTIYIVTFISNITGYTELPSLSLIIQTLPEIAYMVLIAGFIGVLCWNQGNRIITPVSGVLFMDVVPITAFAVSAFLGIIPTTGQILGLLLTATALILNNLYQRRMMLLTSTT